MISGSPQDVIRRLALRVAEQAASPENQRVREKWTRQNALRKTVPPVVCRAYDVVFEIGEPLVATDPLEQQVERTLRILNYKIDLGDDEVFEPWLWIPTVFEDEGPLFGVMTNMDRPLGGGAYRYQPVIASIEDIEKINIPNHHINEAATTQRKERVEELLNGILEVKINRLRLEDIGLGYHAIMLRSIDGFMLDMADRPDFAHALMARLSKCHQAYFEAAEREELLHLNHGGVLSRSALCANELPQKDFDGKHVRREDIWMYADGQDFGIVSPAMTEKFLFSYLLPLLEPFGLVNYGCCESHHNKWQLIRQIPHLRRVSVSPWTDLAEAVEELGGKVVLNWRVNNADVVTQASPERMRAEIREGLRIAGGCPIEITLQDIETVYGNKDLLPTWIRIAREEAEKI